MSSFWSIFVTVVVLLSLVGCIWLVQANSKGKKDGQATGHKWDGDLEELNNPLPKWWYYTFIGLTIWAIGFVLYYPALGNYAGVDGWTQEKQYQEEVVATESKYSKYYDRITEQPIEEMINTPEAVATGRRLFENNCAVCHGIDAKGNQSDGYPNLTDNDWLWGGAPADIVKSITAGRKGNMPSQLATIENVAKSKGIDPAKALDDVTAYAMTLSGNKFSGSANVDNGKVLFDSVCAACHTPAGTGMHALGSANLTDDIWLYNDGSVQKTIEYSIKNGRHGVMPAHEGILSPAKIKTVAAYVYSLSHDVK